MHAGTGALSLAAPLLPLAWVASGATSRRYLAGWCAARTLHLLAPRRARAARLGGARTRATC